MAQTTRPTATSTPARPAPHPEPATHEPPTHEPPAPAIPRMPQIPMAMPPMVTDRNLLDQLRQIYQTANRHQPVPTGTKVSKALEDALEEIAEIAQKAVADYKPE